MAGQVAIGVEVVVLAVAGLEQHGILARGVAVTALGILALGVRGGMALDDTISHVHLLTSRIEQHAPAFQCIGERLRGLGDDLVHVVRREPGTACKLVLKLIDDPAGTGQGPLLDGLRL